MHLSFQVIVQGIKEDFIPPSELGSNPTIGDLKTFLLGNVDLPNGFGDPTWIISRHGAPVTAANGTTLAEAGFQDGEFIAVTAQPGNVQSQARAQTGQSSAAQNANKAAQLEQLRQHILNHAPTRAAVEAQAGRELVQSGEDLNSVLNDPRKFAERWSGMEDRRRAEAEQRYQADSQLDENINEETQKQILKRIQQGQVQQEAGRIMEEHPEFFASVTMLYVNVLVNGHPVKAFVDSGAQMTVISPDKAEECGLTRHIDERYSGIARGVGTARILGRVHQTELTIQDPTGYTDNVPCSFTVMEGKGVDMLLGLDMLKRYRASIDLQENVLRFDNGAKLPFLPESEIPKGEFDQDGLTTTGNKSSAENTSASTGSGAASSAAPSGSNFSGAGHTLGSRPAPSISSSQASTRAPSTYSTASSATLTNPSQAQVPSRPAAQRQPSTHSTQGYRNEDNISMLLESGARNRDHARQLLEACGGNMDMALSVLFDQ